MGSRTIQRALTRRYIGRDGVTRAETLQRDDGSTIAYDVAGHGPLVVFVHGLTSFRQTWDPVTTLLAEEFTCVRLDLRGHGASSRTAEYSMVSLVGDVRAVVEEVALGGGPRSSVTPWVASIAAVYAAAHDARAVVCIDQSLRFGEFAGLVQAHADDLRSQRTMEAVLSIDRALKLEPYTGRREHRAQGAGVSARGRPRNLGRAAEHPSRATDRDRRGDPAPNRSATPIAARLAASTGLRGLAYGPHARRAR